MYYMELWNLFSEKFTYTGESAFLQKFFYFESLELYGKLIQNEKLDRF